MESLTNSIALNSSYPKVKLESDSPMISKTCRECESWNEKDMLYIVGVVDANNLTSLAMVYGSEYCASKNTYEKLRTVIKQGVENISGIVFTETKELGKILKVDPLGITYLRVRGMWGIENPFKVFEYIYTPNPKNKFNFMAVVSNKKYNSFPNRHKLEKICNKD